MFEKLCFDKMTNMLPDGPILFFDGDCGLCNRSVRMLLKMDRHTRLYFAPLQGRTAQEVLPEDLRNELSSAILVCPNGQRFTRSDSALQAIILTGSPWRHLARPSLLLPKSWRDGVYNWIARNRSRFFSQTCPLDTQVAKGHLLD